MPEIKRVNSDEFRDLVARRGIAPNTDFIGKILNEGDQMLTRVEVIERIQEYFDSCTELIVDDFGNEETVWKRTPTKTGLCIALGITLKSLSRYLKGFHSDNKEYGDNGNIKIPKECHGIVRKAVMQVENFHESRLGTGTNVIGSIFWLKNARSGEWLDDSTLRIEGNDKEAIGLPTQSLEQIAQQFQNAELPKPIDLEDLD